MCVIVLSLKHLKTSICSVSISLKLSVTFMKNILVETKLKVNGFGIDSNDFHSHT